VAAIWAPHLGAWRITLTPPALLDARAIVMLVAGGTKAAAVHAAIEGTLDLLRCPAQLLRQAGDRVEWMLDRAAAAELRTGDRE
jgi:6-phosphogluconolactonase/glucosamine-6-phosphate isomerase/deaminase